MQSVLFYIYNSNTFSPIGEKLEYFTYAPSNFPFWSFFPLNSIFTRVVITALYNSIYTILLVDILHRYVVLL